jgi:hypothetical protein
VTHLAGWLRQAAQTPFLALLVAMLAVAGAAMTCSLGPLRGSTYARWDSFNYISIATRGYYLEEEEGGVVGGNAAWFPGYPLLIRAVASRHLTPAKAGKIISTVFAFVLLVALWWVLRESRPDRLSLLLAAFFPGLVYYHTVFPVSMAAALAVVAVLLSANGRHLGAGCAGAVAAFSYPPGFLIGGPLLWGVLHDPRLDTRRRLLAFLEAPLLVGLGLFAVFAYQARSVGWTACLRMRADYFDNAASNPFLRFVESTRHDWTSGVAPTLPRVQTVLVMALVLTSCALAWRHRTALPFVERQLLVCALFFWVFPYFLGRGISPYRAEALVVGIVPLLGRLPLVARCLLLAIFVGIGIGMCRLFFQSVLV